MSRKNKYNRKLKEQRTKNTPKPNEPAVVAGSPSSPGTDIVPPVNPPATATATKSNIINFTPPVIPVIPTPGRVSCKIISLDFSPPATKPATKPATATATATGKKLVKASSQAEDTISIIEPLVSTDVVYRFYEENVFHFRACHFKALCTVGSGFDVVPKDPVQKEPDEKHEDYKKILDFMNADNLYGELHHEVIYNWMLERFMYGYSFLELAPNLKKELTEIYNLRAYYVNAKIVNNRLYYNQTVTTGEKLFIPFGPVEYPDNDKNKILINKSYNPMSRYFGFPEWLPATGDIAVDRSIVEYRLKKFQNNLMMQFMIICEGGDLDDDAMAAVKSFLSDNYKGSSNAGKVLYLNSDRPEVKIRIEKIEAETPEIGFMKAREQHRDIVLNSHGIAPILLGISTMGKLGSTNEIKDAFNIFNEAIAKPEKEKAARLLNKVFEKMLGVTSYKIEFRELNIDRLADLVDFVMKLTPHKIITTDEARRVLNYDPLEQKEPPDEEDLFKRLNKVKSEISEIRKALASR